MSVLETLTEGIKERSLQTEGAALRNKWSETGLLEGLGSDFDKDNMARLLENQAAQLLKEASSMAAGDVQGFASVAFPIVRRVFGSLIANDVVSVQPMSLPSGLIFFMDFTYTDTRLGDGTDASFVADASVYGGGRVGSQLTGGVLLGGREAERGFYALNQGYSSPTGSATGVSMSTIVSGTVGGSDAGSAASFPISSWDGSFTWDSAQELFDYVTRHDVDLQGTKAVVCSAALSQLTSSGASINLDNLISLNYSTAPTSGSLARRLTQRSAQNRDEVILVLAATGSETLSGLSAFGILSADFDFALQDNFTAGDAVGSVVGATPWGLEGAGGGIGGQSLGNSGINDDIPEIDIKVDSVAVTAITKKLKAKWTPELGQDLNAYHNLDAEVELTQILSETIALEIDREILNDLIQGATAGRYFWSRSPGLFVDRVTGQEVGANTAAPDFTGTVSEWYETLVETINDVSAQIHRKTLRGGANFLVTSPEVANILEFTAGFRANVTADTDRGTVGAVNVGSISKKFDVYVDPYFPRNLVLVGRKGSSFLESGYVYAPYVPLQVTPTIFGTEDFVPRKGVMTRYAKKMVRPDMYGLVVVQGMLGQSGA